jgi:hypothetical protein
LTSPVSSSVIACLWTMSCSRAFSSAIAAWEEPLGELHRLLAEAAVRRVEDELHRRRLVAGREVELDRSRVAVEIADPADLLVVVQKTAAAGAGGLGDHVQDHGHQRTGVVRRGERLSHERECLPRLTPAGDRCSATLSVAGSRARALAPRPPDQRDEQDDRHDRRQEGQNGQWPVDLDPDQGSERRVTEDRAQPQPSAGRDPPQARHPGARV